MATLGLLALLLALVLAALLAVWGAGRAEGLAWWLPRVSGVQLQGLQGSVWSGLRIERLRLRTAGQDIEIEQLQWTPSLLRPRRVAGALRIERLALTSRPDAPPSSPLTEAQLLAALRLPVALRLAPLQVQQLQIDALQLRTLQASALQLEAGAVQLQGLQLELPRDGGALQLQADGSLAADGRLRLQARLRDAAQALQAELKAEGPLAALPLQLRLAHASGGRLQADALLALLQAQPLRRLQGQLQALDPQALDSRLPLGLWDGEFALLPQAQKDQLQLRLQAQNARAARLDQQGWPLRRMQLEALLNPAQWQQLQLRELVLELGDSSRSAGRVALAPQPLPQAGQPLRAGLALEAIRLPGLDARWPALQIGGRLQLDRAQLDQGPLQLRTQLRANPLPGLPPLLAARAGWQLDAEAELDGPLVQLQRLALRERGDAGEATGRVQASGSLRWQAPLALRLQLDAQAWDLALPPWQALSVIDGEARIALQQANERAPLTGELRLVLREASRLAGLPLQADAQWQGEASAARWSLRLQAPGAAGTQGSAPSTAPSTVEARGQQPALRGPNWGAALADPARWRPSEAAWQLPQLAQLRPLWQPWLADLQGSSSGRLRDSQAGGLAVQASATGLRLQTGREAAPLALQQLQAQWRWNTPSQAQLRLQSLAGNGWRLPTLALDGRLDAAATDAQAWRLQTELRLPQDGVERTLQLRGSAAPLQGDASAWQLPGLGLSVDEGAQNLLALSGQRLDGALRPSLQLQLQPGEVRVAGESLQLREARLALPDDQPAALRLQLDGSPQLPPWLRLAQPEGGWSGDLRARLALRLQTGAGAPVLQLQLARESGDLRVDGEALGLSQLQLQLEQDAARRVNASAWLQGQPLGEAKLQLSSAANGERLQGSLTAQLPALQALRPWLQAGGLLLAGSADAQLRFGGSLAAPRVEGRAGAQLTRLLHTPSGAGLSAARLQLQLDEQSLRITELSGEGLSSGKDGAAQGGTLRGSGALRWGEGPSQTSQTSQISPLRGELQLEAQQLRLLNRFDRRLVASGHVQLQLQPQLLRLRGKLAADEGAFEIGQSEAPVLDDDVRVRRDAGTAPVRRGVPRLVRDIELQLLLGERLRIAGRGLSSRLTGQLLITDRDNKGLQANGRIELNGGRYRAYGQNLEIETGVLSFTGALDNPRIELLAIRPNLEQRVGVEATGRVANPRVRLYSEPELPERDKLAWLLLGRAPDELGRTDAAILQRAALAVLSGEGGNPATELLDRIGLTEFSVAQGDDAGTTLRLGAQLSQRWSLGYERSLDAATGSWQLIYRIGQRFRLRAQSGETSAVDLLWLWRFD